jgi:phage tail sheath gpL-like
MAVTSNPKVLIQLTPADIVQAVEERRSLVTGQLGVSATAAAGALVQNVHAMTNAEIFALFGVGELSHRIFSLLSSAGKYYPVDVIGMAVNGGATAAAGTVTFAGTATESKSIYIGIVDAVQWNIQIDIVTGDTAAVVAGKLNTAIAAQVNPVFTASVLGAVVTITANDLGTYGNDYGLSVTGSAAGITTALVAFTGGATNPVLTTIFDGVGDIRYTSILWPEAWKAQWTTLNSFLLPRFNADNAVLDGQGFIGSTDTYANNKTLMADKNSQVVVFAGNNKISTSTHKGPAILRPADYVLAEFVGIRERRLTTNAPVANYIVAKNGPLDAVGGPSLASLPLFNTPLYDTPVGNASELYTEIEQADLEAEAFSIYGVNRAKNTAIMGPVTTSWTTDQAGNLNPSFKYLEYVDTGSICREIFMNVLKATYAQSRLTQGDLVEGRSFANAASIEAKLLSIYKTLSLAGLVQAGREAEKYFTKGTVVTIDMALGKATVYGPLPIVTQLRRINYTLQFSFDITGGAGILL